MDTLLIKLGEFNMKKLTIMLLTSWLSISTAFAVDLVFDAKTFAEAGKTAVEAANTAANTAVMVGNTYTMIKNQVQALQTFPEDKWQQVKGAFEDNEQQVESLLLNMKGISFDMDGIDGSFADMFPEGTDWSNINLSDYSSYFSKWGDEIKNASSNAMKGQSILDKIGKNNETIQGILKQVEGADGQVRQMQNANQMLGLLGNQLGDISASLATTGKLTATATAQAQAETEAQRELMDKYSKQVEVPQNDGKKYW